MEETGGMALAITQRVSAAWRNWKRLMQCSVMRQEDASENKKKVYTNIVRPARKFKHVTFVLVYIIIILIIIYLLCYCHDNDNKMLCRGDLILHIYSIFYLFRPPPPQCNHYDHLCDPFMPHRHH